MDRVNPLISPYTVVYDCACLTWSAKTGRIYVLLSNKYEDEQNSISIHSPVYCKFTRYSCPGQSAPVVNDQAQMNYDWIRHAFTVVVYNNRLGCFTLYYNHRKLYP
jgi:hypothetical protein